MTGTGYLATGILGGVNIQIHDADQAPPHYRREASSYVPWVCDEQARFGSEAPSWSLDLDRAGGNFEAQPVDILWKRHSERNRYGRPEFQSRGASRAGAGATKARSGISPSAGRVSARGR